MNSYTRPSSPFANISPVVKNLLIINGIFYLATMLFSSNGSYPLVQYLAVYYPDSPFFRPWQIITYMFMHSPVSFAHIAFNMFALFTFGNALEYVMGSKRFLTFYLLTGLGALVLQFAVQAFEVYSIAGSIRVDPSMTIANQSQFETLRGIYSSPMLGASGAIFGVLIAFGMLFPNAELFIIFFPVPIKAKYIIPVYIVLELFLGVSRISGDSVAHFAHLGGALFGFLLVKMWGIRRQGGFF